MTFPRREDATNKDLILTIIEIQGHLERYGKSHTNWHETLNEVTERLKDADELEQEPCEDTISRQAVLDVMLDTWRHICHVARRRKPTKGEEAVYADMIGAMKQLPPVSPARPTGKWIDATYEDIKSGKCGSCECICSLCGEIGLESDNFCPNCGADMKGDNNDRQRSN